MALSDYLLPSFPEVVRDRTGETYIYKYRGPEATLSASAPQYGDEFPASSGRTVLSVRLRELENQTYAELIVEAGYDGTPGTLTTGQVTNNEFPFYEVSWVAVQKDLREHPAFADFTEEMWQSVDDWIAETDSDARRQGKYYKKDKDGQPTGSLVDLSTTDSPDGSPADFCFLYYQGVRYYNDYLPVARQTSLYEGQTKPATGGAGEKIVGDPFTGVPTGYEWIKTGDSATKQGRGYRWTKVEEWTGALSILVDSQNIY